MLFNLWKEEEEGRKMQTSSHGGHVEPPMDAFGFRSYEPDEQTTFHHAHVYRDFIFHGLRAEVLQVLLFFEITNSNEYFITPPTARHAL